MIKTKSEAIKNQGSALRRTATAVRNLASALHDIKNQQTLIAAAMIIEAQAGEKMKDAKTQAAEEKRFEDARAKALPVARELVKTLPASTTAEKLALMTESYKAGYILAMIRGDYVDRIATPKVMQRELIDALEEMARCLAFDAARKKTAPEISEHLLLRLQRQSKQREIIEAAALFDRANATEAATC